jgi:hemerythrin-like domain-containing protein
MARRSTGRKGSRRTAGRSSTRGKSQRRQAEGRRTRRGAEAARSAGGGATDALSVLKRQHDETRKLFQDLAEAAGAERRELFQRLADAIEAHSSVEERLVYPEIARSLEELRPVALDSAEEHLIVKRLLADMLEKGLGEEVFDAKARVLELEVLRHLEEEEAVMFPRVRKQLGRDRLAALGPEIERAFEETMRSEPRRLVARETDSAAPLG